MFVMSCKTPREGRVLSRRPATCFGAQALAQLLTLLQGPTDSLHLGVKGNTAADTRMLIPSAAHCKSFHAGKAQQMESACPSHATLPAAAYSQAPASTATPIATPATRESTPRAAAAFGGAELELVGALVERVVLLLGALVAVVLVVAAAVVDVILQGASVRCLLCYAAAHARRRGAGHATGARQAIGRRGGDRSARVGPDVGVRHAILAHACVLWAARDQHCDMQPASA